MSLLHKLQICYLALVLNGCCAFMPCHPGSWYSGTVTNLDGIAIESTKVGLYGTNVNIGPDGCFKFHMADAYPLKLVANAEGYKPISTDPKRGFYRVKIKLAEVNSSKTSLIEWQPITSTEFEKALCK